MAIIRAVCWVDSSFASTTAPASISAFTTLGSPRAAAAIRMVSPVGIFALASAPAFSSSADHVGIVIFDRDLERGEVVAALLVRVGAGVEQQLRSLGVFIADGPMQGRRTVGCEGGDVGFALALRSCFTRSKSRFMAASGRLSVLAEACCAGALSEEPSTTVLHPARAMQKRPIPKRVGVD